VVAFVVKLDASGFDAYSFQMGFGYSGHTLLLVACNSVPNILALAPAQGDGILGIRDATLAVLCKIFRHAHYSANNLAGVVENRHAGMQSSFVHPVVALAYKLESAWERSGSILHASQLMFLTLVQGLVLWCFDCLPQALALPCLIFRTDYTAGDCIAIAHCFLLA
jgi:hypothetical protein